MNSKPKTHIIISAIIVIALLSFNLKHVFLQYEFTFNNKSFTEKYCVNKDKPELKCNGKCHLKESLKSENEKPTNISFFDIEINLICNTILSFEVVTLHIFKQTPHFKNRFLSTEFKNLIEHPPQYLM